MGKRLIQAMEALASAYEHQPDTLDDAHLEVCIAANCYRQGHRGLWRQVLPAVSGCRDAVGSSLKTHRDAFARRYEGAGKLSVEEQSHLLKAQYGVFQDRWSSQAPCGDATVFADPINGNLPCRQIESLLLVLGEAKDGGQGSAVSFFSQRPPARYTSIASAQGCGQVPRACCARLMLLDPRPHHSATSRISGHF